MKKTFLAGLATLLPITITLIVIVFVIDFLTAPFTDLVEEIIIYYGGTIAQHHQYLLLIGSRLIILVLFAASIFLLGFLGRRIFFSWFLHWTSHLFNKIPIVKTIYRVIHDITKNVFSEEKKKFFKSAAVVPFPRDNTHALALLSGDSPTEVGKSTDERIRDKTFKSIFIPTAPHPISGFLLMYSEHEVKTIDIETEDVFKFLISCGMFHPSQKNDAIKDKK